MSADEWSWIAAAASVVGVWISGSNPRRGWIYGIGCQFLYVAYGLATDQSGMIAMSFVFAGLYVRNIRRWKGMAPVASTDVTPRAAAHNPKPELVATKIAA